MRAATVAARCGEAVMETARAPARTDGLGGLVGLRGRAICVMRTARCCYRYQCYGSTEQKRDDDVKNAAEGFFARCEHESFLEKK